MEQIKSRTITYPLRRLLFLCLGLIIMAFGVAFSIKAGLGTSPISSVPYVTSEISGLSVGTTAGEGIVLAICQVAPVKFGNTKMFFDVTLVCIAIVLSLVFLHHLAGVREGTIAAAILVGQITKQTNKLTKKLEAAAVR